MRRRAAYKGGGYGRLGGDSRRWSEASLRRANARLQRRRNAVRCKPLFDCLSWFEHLLNLIPHPVIGDNLAFAEFVIYLEQQTFDPFVNCNQCMVGG